MGDVTDGPIAIEIAGVKREVSLLSAGVSQIVAALATQGELLRLLLEAVTAPDESKDGLAEALARIAEALEDQSQQLSSIGAGIATIAANPEPTPALGAT